ncbi:MAG: hypothetical protein ACE5E1_11010 [Phycisphaerae bacterium]
MATPAPGQVTTAPDQDLSHGRRLLEGVRDHVFSFDDPAFYWFRRYVKHDSQPAKYDMSAADEPVPWKYLMERPGDYRGELILIEGVLLRSSAYEVPNRQGGGTYHQCELGDRGTRAICTVVVTEAPEGIPNRGRVRTKGYFLKVRAYRTADGRTGEGPLLVARRLQRVARAPVESFGDGLFSKAAPRWLIGATVLLAFAWLFLRRSLRSRRETPLRGTASGPSPTGTEDDCDWLTRGESAEPPDDRGELSDGANP